MYDRIKNLLFGSLRKQLMVGMALVISLMMGLFVWGMTSRQQVEEAKSHSLQVSALAESAATSSALWVASRDYSGLQEIVLGIAHYPQLNYIIVLDLHGQVLAHNDSSKIGLYLTDMPQKNEQPVVYRTSNLVEAISPISLSSQQVGWVRLGINRGHFQEEIALIRRDGLVLTLIGIVLSVLAAFFAGRILTRRLSAIQQVADRVEAGQSLARVALVGEDEAARLAQQFNRMLDSLSQREVAIKESEERFHSIFEHSSSVMLLIDPSSGKIVEGNGAALTYYGYARGQLTSLSINEINILPAEQVAEEMQRALHEERNYYIFQHRLALGEIRDVEVYSTPIESGGRKLLFSIVHDITQRKLAEISLSKSERKLEVVLQTMVDGLVTIDTAGVINYANLAAQKILSISKEAISGKYFQSQEFRQVGENGAPFPQEQLPLAIALREQRQVSDVVHAIVTPDNKVKWLSVNAAPLFDEDGNLAGGIATFTDITERKKSEEKTRANEERMRIFFDNVPLGIFSSTRAGKFAYVNPALPQMLGYDSCEDLMEVVNRTSVAETLYVEPPRRQAIMQELDADYRHWKTFENRYRRKDGQIIDTIVSIGERQDLATGETIFDGIVTNITERKKIEEIQTFLAKTTSVHLGESFFEDLARYLSQSLGMFYVCIDRLEGDGLNATTLAIWCDGHFEDNATYALKDTPCGDVVGQKVCCFPASVCQYFPRDQVLQDLCAESYIGVTLFSHSGQPIGLIAVIGRTPLANRPLAESILKLVADRAAGELERLFAEEKLQLSANVFSHSREGILITAVDGTIMEVNEAFTRITGYSRDEVVGKNPRILSSGRQSKEFYAAFWLNLAENGYWSGEVWNRRKNGEVYAELITVSAVRNADGQTQHYVALFSDISNIKEHEQQLEHIAHYDTLTNLPNRVLLADRLHQGMTQAQRRNQRLAVVYLDLDGFKAVNDSHGHDVGDQLLMAVATRMKQALREGDTLARIGGDEFVAVLLDLADIESSVPMLDRLLAAAAQPVEIGGLVLRVSASLGVTLYPQGGSVDADQLMRQADQAMYQAKLAGRNRFSVFDAEHDSSIRIRHEGLEEIRRALIAREFVLYYQPKVNMRSGAVVGAEALIRWQHPQKGLLPPDTFLPVIEEHPLAVQIGDWVIDTALTQIEFWQEAGLDIPVSVNVGAQQLQQAGFAESLRQMFAAHPKVKPNRLEIEVLETSALEDVEHVSQVIEACRAIGVGFALDDFGTGYSSLTYLKRLPVSLLKIDQSFVRDMLNNSNDLAILQGVLGLAKAFDLEVIAEGVETLESGELLLQLGCDLGQGYVIARPMPAHEMPHWAATWHPDASWVNCK